MKILKYIALALVGIIAVLLIAAAFIAKEYTVVRDVTINKPSQQVFDYIKFQKNQANFSKWVMADPNMKAEYRGIDGTVGFVSAWDSQDEEVGKGEQEITKIVDGKSVNCEIRFLKPFEGIAQTTMTTADATSGGTIVTWTFSSKINYPMNAMLLFMDMEEMLGTDMQQSLLNLKAILEK